MKQSESEARKLQQNIKHPVPTHTREQESDWQRKRHQRKETAAGSRKGCQLQHRDMSPPPHNPGPQQASCKKVCRAKTTIRPHTDQEMTSRHDISGPLAELHGPSERRLLASWPHPMQTLPDSRPHEWW